MGLFSFGSKDDVGSARATASARAGRVSRFESRANRRADPEAMLLDPTLPEKQRARRRLVGAIALVVAAVVVLPMILDSDPRPVTDDIAINIPARPGPAPAPSQARDDDVTAAAAPDNPPPVAGPSGAQQAGGKPTDIAHERARAQTSPDASVDASTASGAPNAPAGNRYVVQLGALDNEAAARDWVGRLKALGVPAYIERRRQPDGVERVLLRAGPFANRAAASAAVAKVREAGLTAGADGRRAQ